jgi:2-hydroxymuconate-semialdehyde hydrolase
MAAIRVGNADIELIEQGRGDPVLLVHGYPTSRLLWQRVLPRLAASFHVLALDLEGYGKSSGDGPVDLASQAGRLLQLLDVLGLPRVSLVAHDVGSAAAQILAVRAQERLRALVIIDGVHAGSWALQSIEPVRAWDVGKAASLAKVLARTMHVKDPALREILAEYEGEAGGRRLIRAAQALDPDQTRSIAGELGKLRLPSLVIWGDRDEYLSVDEVGKPLATALGARLVVLPGGHFLPLDAPEALCATLEAFLTGIE